MTEENIHTDITLTDVNLILQIINVCSKRGAIQPDEFLVVGKLTEKLHRVVENAKPKEEPVENKTSDEQ